MNGTGTLRPQALATMLSVNAPLLCLLCSGWRAAPCRPPRRLMPARSSPSQAPAAQVAAPSPGEIQLPPDATSTPLGLPTEAPCPPPAHPPPAPRPNRTPEATEPADPRIIADPRVTRLLAELQQQERVFQSGRAQPGRLPGAGAGRGLPRRAPAGCTCTPSPMRPRRPDGPPKSQASWTPTLSDRLGRRTPFLPLRFPAGAISRQRQPDAGGVERSVWPGVRKGSFGAHCHADLPTGTVAAPTPVADATRLPTGDPAKGASGAAQPLPQMGKLAFVRGGSVWTIDLPDGRPRRLTQGADDRSPRWSSSGQWLAYVGSGGAWVVRAGGQDARRHRGLRHAGAVGAGSR